MVGSFCCCCSFFLLFSSCCFSVRWIGGCFLYCVLNYKSIQIMNFSRSTRKKRDTYITKRKWEKKRAQEQWFIICVILYTFNHGHSQILLPFSKLCILEWTLINLWVKFFVGLWIFGTIRLKIGDTCMISRSITAETVKTHHHQPHFRSLHENLFIYWSVQF